MKQSRILLIISVLLILAFCILAFAGCDNKKNVETGKENETETSLSSSPYRFTAPQGTPALAILRLCVDNKQIAGKNMEYEIVQPNNIALEMNSGKSDLVIMPVNAGANFIVNQKADYKLVSVAVNGSLYMMGKGENDSISFNDIKGKKIACIGQTGVPGLVFRYVMKKNGITVITEGTPDATNNEVFVQYVADGAEAKVLFADKKVDYAVVGEPAATAAFKTALACNAEMNLQTEYAKCSEEGITDYPQAGLFIKTSITKNESFMTELFDALQASKEWTLANKSEITNFAKENLYESAAFPPASIPRCAINANQLSENEKSEIIAFLNAVMPKDSKQNEIDWVSNKSKLFA